MGVFFMFMAGLPEHFFSFIPGEAVGYGRPYTGEKLQQLSRIVKQLHSIPGEVFADICPVEAYELPFCDALERLLLSQTGGLPETFRKEAEGKREMLLDGMETLRKEARKLKGENLPFVLCYTDIHGGNLIWDPQGKLWLID